MATEAIEEPKIELLVDTLQSVRGNSQVSFTVLQTCTHVCSGLGEIHPNVAVATTVLGHSLSHMIAS